MTNVHVVYTDKGVFLETLGFILYNNTFVVNSLLSLHPTVKLLKNKTQAVNMEES